MGSSKLVQDWTKVDIKYKYLYLKNVIYEQIKNSSTGKLLINTSYCRKVANLLGGNYDSLNKIQKDIFKSDIVFKNITIEDGFEKYEDW